jgi:hypothetical protein
VQNLGVLMFLDANDESLEVILAGAKSSADCPFFVSWGNLPAGDSGMLQGVTNGAAAVTIAAAPASGQKTIRLINLHNDDTGAITATIRLNKASAYTPLISPVLQVQETLQWTPAQGWVILDATGAQKIAMSGTGRWLKTTVLTAGTSFTTQMQTTSIFTRMVGGGGGGGGATFSTPNMGFGGGGASGAYAEKTFTVTPNTAYTYAIGGVGAAGANTGGTGGTGGDTTFAVGGTTVTAKGGLGGVGQTAGATLALVLGGKGVISTNGDINAGGEPGQAAVRLSGLLGGSGAGGSSPLGGGGGGLITNGAGQIGLGYGAGGGGAAAVSASVAGATGTAGVIIVDEYA